MAPEERIDVRRVIFAERTNVVLWLQRTADTVFAERAEYVMFAPHRLATDGRRAPCSTGSVKRSSGREVSIYEAPVLNG